MLHGCIRCIIMAGVLKILNYLVAVSLFTNTCIFGEIVQRVRLVNGSHPQEGRLEVMVHDKWGTVCDDKFDYAAAVVVCRMLGYPNSGAIAYHEGYFGQGTGQIQLDEVQCIRTETDLNDCRFRIVTDCTHSEDVGVSCEENCLADYNHTQCYNEAVVPARLNHCRVYRALTSCLRVQIQQCPEESEVIDINQLDLAEGRLCTELRRDSIRCIQVAQDPAWQELCTLNRTNRCTRFESYGECVLTASTLIKECKSAAIMALSQYYYSARGWKCLSGIRPTRAPTTIRTPNPTESSSGPSLGLFLGIGVPALLLILMGYITYRCIKWRRGAALGFLAGVISANQSANKEIPAATQHSAPGGRTETPQSNEPHVVYIISVQDAAANK